MPLAGVIWIPVTPERWAAGYDSNPTWWMFGLPLAFQPGRLFVPTFPRYLYDR